MHLKPTFVILVLEVDQHPDLLFFALDFSYGFVGAVEGGIVEKFLRNCVFLALTKILVFVGEKSSQLFFDHVDLVVRLVILLQELPDFTHLLVDFFSVFVPVFLVRLVLFEVEVSFLSGEKFLEGGIFH